MKIIKKAVRVFESINKHSGVLFGFLVIPIVLAITFEVVSRYIFNAPTAWANQFSQLVYGAYLLIGGAYTLLYNGHIKMDVLYNRIQNLRVRAILDSFTYLFFLFFCIVLLYQSMPVVWEATITNRKTYELLWNVPIWPTYWFLPLATFLLLIEGVIKFGRILNIAITGRLSE